MNQLDRFLEEYYAKNQNSGCLRVTKQDRVIYEKHMGWADRERKQPFEKGSLFSLYSISKPFCAMGLLRLVEQGLVSLEAHPSSYVPEAGGFDSRVTVRHLLQHISGVPDFVQTGSFHKKYATGLPGQLRQQLKELAALPQVFAPGTAGMYANINYILAAMIIENVTGREYGAYMQEAVFAPLGMKNAMIDREGLQLPQRVTGYERPDGVITRAERSLHWMHGAGDVLATMDDVYRLNHAIKHKLLLKPETWEQVLTPSPLNNMGFGCRITQWHGRKRITHNGGSTGFRTLHIQLPQEDFDILYLSNSGWGEARWEIAEAVCRTFLTTNGQEDRSVMDQGYI